MDIAPLCPYCGAFTKKVNGDVIYKHRLDLAHLKFYLCARCDAYVGTHRATGKALGTPANESLRRLRNAVHAVFDPLWYACPDSPDMYKVQRKQRTELYAWLRQMMSLTEHECHVAMFNEEQCLMAIKLCKERIGSL